MRRLALALVAALFALEGQQVPSSYVLGPDDQIIIRVADSEEISEKPLRVDLRGNINLPMAGRVHAGGLTTEQLEAELVLRLKKYLQKPEVTVVVTEFRSQPVSVLGSVANPGVHQLQGRKTLFEILSMAGGLKPDAGNSIKITRQKRWGPIPLKTAKEDPTGGFSVAELRVKAVMEGKSPEENIQIMPNDVISVPKADMVYVIGSVKRPGGYVVGEREAISVLQALSMAEGLDRFAASSNAKILRMASGTSARLEVPVDVKKILAGKANDVALQPDDILFVPNSTSKAVASRTLDAAISIGSGIAIYSRF